MTIDAPVVLVALLANPSLGFGNSYTDGRLRIEGDLQAMLGEAFENSHWRRLPGTISRFSEWLRRAAKLPVMRSNAVYNARYHYDRGNDFSASGSIPR